MDTSNWPAVAAPSEHTAEYSLLTFHSASSVEVKFVRYLSNYNKNACIGYAPHASSSISIIIIIVIIIDPRKSREQIYNACICIKAHQSSYK